VPSATVGSYAAQAWDGLNENINGKNDDLLWESTGFFDIYIYIMNHYGDIIGIQWNIASGKLTQLLNIIILP